MGPFAILTCLCPCDEEGGSRGHGYRGGNGGYYNNNGNGDALLTGVLIGEALGGDGGDYGGDGGDYGGDGGDFGGDFGGD